MRTIIAAALILSAVTVPGAAVAVQQDQPGAGTYSRADIESGSRLFAVHCTSCHGTGGDAVPGVNLGGQLRRGASDRELRGILTNGITGTAMPPGKFSDAELASLVAYVRNMRALDGPPVARGDAARGRVLFEQKGGCTTCHRVSGQGPRVAPDLTNIGAVRTASVLERVLVDPTGTMLPSNRSVRAVTRDGEIIRGRRLNEDTHTVQLIDEKERLLSLEKSTLTEFVVVKTSSMPSYRDTLTADERADIVAYLMSLTGVK